MNHVLALTRGRSFIDKNIASATPEKLKMMRLNKQQEVDRKNRNMIVETSTQSQTIQE
jgi:hypothetical protein